MPCDHLRELVKAEEFSLREEIAKNKDYLSRKLNHNVEWKEAEMDFVEHYLRLWAVGFKDCYCNYVCMKEGCDSKDE